MKIGIVTFHFAYNYGAVLQAWALQTYLRKCGHEVELINYRPYYHTERYQLFRNVLLAGRAVRKKKHAGFFRAARAVIGTAVENVYMLKSRIRKKNAFERFISSFINQSKLYKNVDELLETSISYDVLITGSDQVWNRYLTNDTFDPVYFLKFGREKIKRIAYGVSLGETTIEDCISYIKGSHFIMNLLSFRERNDAEEANRLLGLPCFAVPDPTLLLNADDYKNIETDTTEGNYVVVYILKQNPILESIIRQFLKMGKKILNISPISIAVNGMRTIYPISPSEFIGFIRHADYVITNSFHGTVFSLIYRKMFFCGLHGARNQRIQSLLTEVGLEGRIITDISQFDALLCSDIDYGMVNRKLSSLSSKGKLFLKTALQE